MGPIHPVWALAAIHPRWGKRYVIRRTASWFCTSSSWYLREYPADRFLFLEGPEGCRNDPESDRAYTF